MSSISRIVVLVTALASVFGVMSATAGAVTWTNDGSTTFTATGGPGTLTSTGVQIKCNNADASGTAPASFVGNTYLISGTIAFTNCTAAGSPATIDCGFTLTETTIIPPIATGNVDYTCGLYLSNVKLCAIGGIAHAQYTNETGTLQVTDSNSLWVAGASCPAGANDPAHLTFWDFRVTSASPPTITRA